MQLIIGTFDAASQAEHLRAVLENFDRQADLIQLGNVAVVRRSADGQIAIVDRNDPRDSLGQIVGTLAGGVTDFLSRFVGLLDPHAGAYVAEEANNVVHQLVRDTGFPDDALYSIGELLRAGQAALVALVRPADSAFVTAELERFGGTIVAHQLPQNVIERLSE